MTDRRVRKPSPRARICHACFVPTDLKLGHVHSELGCQRCSQAPCWGFIVEPSAALPLEDVPLSAAASAALRKGLESARQDIASRRPLVSWDFTRFASEE